VCVGGCLDGTENFKPNKVPFTGRINGCSDNKILSIGEVYKDKVTNNNKSDTPMSTEMFNMS
jgi:hypothetical protein